MSPPPIPIPRPNPAPRESAGETASTAQGRPNERQATRAGKNRSVITRPSEDEDEYARLYDKLSSPDPDQIDAALATLRKIKAVEDEAVEAAQRRPPDDLLPPPERDLSEPISFGSRFSTTGVP